MASSWSTSARSAPATSAATSGVVARSDTVGNHVRRACLAASRAVDRHLSADFAARSPFHTATQREAAQGTTTATPTSVSTSTASSPRSPFGNAWTTTMLGTGAGWSRTADTTTSNELFEVAVTSPTAERPAPSVSTTASPTRSRRTVTAWCASAPVTVTVAPTAASRAATRWTGRVISAC